MDQNYRSTRKTKINDVPFLKLFWKGKFIEQKHKKHNNLTNIFTMKYIQM